MNHHVEEDLSVVKLCFELLDMSTAELMSV